MHRARLALAVPLVVLLAVAACSDDDTSSTAAEETGSTVEETTTTEESTTTSSEAETTTTTEAPAPCPSDADPLEIVLVNDDGVINPAIDTMVEALDELGGVELTIVAPAEERSGSSDQTTPGGAPYEEAETPSGNPAYAVDGFPADAIGVALDDLGLDPHLFVSGVNPGQNVGTLAAISGTVGVGRTAVRRDYPALALSAGLEFVKPQFDVAADLGIDWIEENCEKLLDGSAQTKTVTSINVPACPPNQMGELQEVPLATEMPADTNVFESSCDQSDPDPANDVAALVAGYPSITQVPPELPGG